MSLPDTAPEMANKPTPVQEGASEGNQEHHKGEWIRVNRSEDRRKKRLERNHRQFHDLMTAPVEEQYTKVYIIKFPGKNIEKDINIIQTNKDLRQQIGGNPEKLVKSGFNALHISVTSKKQGEKVQSIKKIGGNPVVVEEHRTLNSTRGVVRSAGFGHSTMEELKESLLDQGVTDIRRMSVREGSKIIQTDTYFITFNRITRPASLRLDWYSVRVSEYKEKPQFCFNCQKFSHVSKYCRQEAPTCVVCGVIGHSGANCTSDTANCANCQENHRANSKQCRRYLLETEILATVSKERTSKYEARQIVLARTPAYNTLYSDITRENNPTHSQRAAAFQQPQAPQQPSAPLLPAAPQQPNAPQQHNAPQQPTTSQLPATPKQHTAPQQNAYSLKTDQQQIPKTAKIQAEVHHADNSQPQQREPSPAKRTPKKENNKQNSNKIAENITEDLDLITVQKSQDTPLAVRPKENKRQRSQSTSRGRLVDYSEEDDTVPERKKTNLKEYSENKRRSTSIPSSKLNPTSRISNSSRPPNNSKSAIQERFKIPVVQNLATKTPKQPNR
jgi:hypothetical protein